MSTPSRVRPKMTPERLDELIEMCEHDLAEARRQGHKAWVVSQTWRRAALREVQLRMPEPEAEE